MAKLKQSINNYPLYRTFQIIGLTGRPRGDNHLCIHRGLFQWLLNSGYDVLVEKEIGQQLNLEVHYLASLEEIAQKVQLVIVIGGDGNMLSRARFFSQYNIPLIGVNRGNLGFLTDIDPKNMYRQLDECLEKGEFFVEERFLLDVSIERDGEIADSGCAINEVVVHPAKIAHMIDFHVYINGSFAFSQHSDGLIIATPTGSTAYSLSAGGPIMIPELNAIALVPMFPHTLSSRPLVIDGESHITIRFIDPKSPALEVGCDSQINLNVKPSDKLHIKKSTHKLRLLHLANYDYYSVLSTKLGWLKK